MEDLSSGLGDRSRYHAHFHEEPHGALPMATQFKKLNHDWNAEPNAPDIKVSTDDSGITLSFLANPFQFPDFDNGQMIELRFSDVWRYGIGTINDEGWYRGQCRFSKSVRRWGEFYCVTGDLMIDKFDGDWQILTDAPKQDLKHYLFYFRDCNFECDATKWERIR